MIFRLVLSDIEGAVAPRGFGVAYRDHLLRVTVLYLWPLNHLVAAWRRFWWWARDARAGEAEKQLSVAWQTAQDEGFRRGYRDGLREGIKVGRAEGVTEEQARVAGILDGFSFAPNTGFMGERKP